jgi:hypothetical protein
MTRSLQTAFYVAFASLTLFGQAVAQYPRNVLIEEFTSATCVPCKTASSVLNSTLGKFPGRVVSIRYHLNLPVKGDPMYNANPTDANARKTLYFPSDPALPQVRFNGQDIPGAEPTNAGSMEGADTGMVSQQAPAKIDVAQTI